MLAILARGAFCLILVSGFAVASEARNAEDSAAPPALGIEGIAATTGEDDPRILFILPWQPPSLPQRPRAELTDRDAGLEEPLDPIALENHRRFRDTLDPFTLEPRGF